jgi:cytochrome c
LRFVTAVCALFAASLLPAKAEDWQVTRGRTFVTEHCSQCHAVGLAGRSAIAEAPPFRDLHTRYTVESLEESLAEGIMTGHPSMPEFRLDLDQVRNVIAYLKSLER